MTISKKPYAEKAKITNGKIEIPKTFTEKKRKGNRKSANLIFIFLPKANFIK